MQSTVHHKSKSKRHFRNEIKQIHEELAQKEFASTIEGLVTKNTYAGVQSLKVNLEPNRVTLTGICESYYVKQLAQQSIMGIAVDREIVNEIAVI